MPTQTAQTIVFGNIRAELTRFEDHLRAANKSPRTIESYGESVRQLCDYLAAQGMPLGARGIRREHIESYLNDLAERGRSEATRALRYRSIRVFFGWLVDEEEIDNNPMAKMRPPKVAEVPVPALSQAQIDKMLAATRGKGFEDRRDYALLAMYVDTGARLSELADLLVEDLDLANGTAMIVRKGGNRRVLVFGNTVRVALNSYLRQRERHRAARMPDLWLGRRGRLEPRGIVQALRKVARVAGVDGFHVHQLRHTFANNWLEDGGSESDLIRNMGWSPRTGREMASRYTAANADQRAAEAARRFSRLDRVGTR